MNSVSKVSKLSTIICISVRAKKFRVQTKYRNSQRYQIHEINTEIPHYCIIILLRNIIKLKALFCVCLLDGYQIH